jgi:hypothetical protein
VPVTGSRTWRDAHAVGKALDALAAAHPGVSLRHGGCPSGGDRFTELWCRARQIIPERYKTKWGRLGREVAGAVGNPRVIDSAPDECLAFIDPCSDPRCRRPWPHGSYGATDCVDRAEAGGIPTRRQGHG